MKIFKYRDYRDYLRDELERRISKNPSYSLRAFAQHLGMTPQMLSFVLNRKKNISLPTAMQVADRLNLGPELTNRFLDLVIFTRSKHVGSAILEDRLKLRESIPSYFPIEPSKFKIISDWYHYGILELTQTKGFKPDPNWIARRLGINSFEAKKAIDRLKEQSLLQEKEDGSLVRTEANVTTGNHVPSTALRKLAKQYLEKSISALESQTIDERDITNITMSIDPSRIPQAKKMIADFRRQLCAFLEEGERSEVYTFSPSLFRLSKNITEIQK